MFVGILTFVCSLQFDPAPRAGEPLVSRRVPDYFLVSYHCIHCFDMISLSAQTVIKPLPQSTPYIFHPLLVLSRHPHPSSLPIPINPPNADVLHDIITTRLLAHASPVRCCLLSLLVLNFSVHHDLPFCLYFVGYLARSVSVLSFALDTFHTYS